MRNLRLVSVILCVVAGSDAGCDGVAAARDASLTVFLNFPMANGFSDATHALVETKELVRQQLSAATGLRLVDRPEDADVVLTVLGRGKGYAELTAALDNISDSIVAPSVPNHQHRALHRDSPHHWIVPHTATHRRRACARFLFPSNLRGRRVG